MAVIGSRNRNDWLAASAHVGGPRHQRLNVCSLDEKTDDRQRLADARKRRRNRDITGMCAGTRMDVKLPTTYAKHPAIGSTPKTSGKTAT